MKLEESKLIVEDQNALKNMEKLLNQNVEETVMEHPDGLESPLHILERRLVIAEEEKALLQRNLRELEEEKERLALELQAQREGERNRLILAEEEKARISFKTCKGRKRTIRSFCTKLYLHQLPREGLMLPQ